MSLRCLGLVVGVGDRVLLPATDLELAAGDSLAVVGPSGAGKTSVLSVLAGFVPPTHGSVTLSDVAVTRAPRGDIGVVTQPVLLAGTLTVGENIALPMQTVGWSRADLRLRVADLLDRLSLTGVADRQPGRLSGGQRQRVAVARAVAATPRLVVADEPTSELDHDSRGRVTALLLEAAAAGSTLVISTHDESVAELCHHVLDLRRTTTPS
jgi:ABC-type lipoprotein export system ATPase subunit